MRWMLGPLTVLGLLFGSLLGLLASPAMAGAAGGRAPVIIIPGLGGSEFAATRAFRLSVDNGHGGAYANTYSAGEKVWVNTFQILLPGDDDYLDALKLQQDGTTPVAPAVQVSNIYGGAYGDLIDYLQRQGYVQGVDLWPFAYDWRQDVGTTVKQLDAVIGQALVAANGGRTNPATWTTRRVNLVAHSLGGLLGRAYIADRNRANRVDQLLTLGAPELGAPKSLKALVYGDQFGPWFLGIGLNPEEVKDLSQNMTAGMQLLPSRSYNRFYDNSDATRLRPWVEDRDIDGDGAALGVLGYDQMLQLLRNLGKNGPLLDRADAFHTKLDGQTNGGVNGVRWSALIGFGYGTLGQIREYTGLCRTLWWYQPCPKRDETPVDGDGTVPVLSAAMGDPWRNSVLATGAELSYVQREHTAMVKRDYNVLGIATGDGPGLEWIGATLARVPGSASSRPGVLATADNAGHNTSSAPSATQTPHNLLSGGAWISALGPVAMQVSDADGRTTGRMRGSSSATVSIPDTAYDQLPEGEFAFIKDDVGHTINLAAERAGSIDFKVRVLNNGRIERTAVYLGVFLGPAGRARLAIGQGTRHVSAPGGWPSLQVDADGDGTFEDSVAPAAVLDAAQSGDTRAPDLMIDSPAPAPAAGGSVTVHWRTADGGAGLLAERAVLDPDATPRAVTNGERVPLSAGPHRLVVIAVDRAGNARSQQVSFMAP